MNLPTKLVISLLIAAAAATLVSVMQSGSLFNPVLLLAFAIATVCSTLVAVAGKAAPPAVAGKAAPPAAAAGRSRPVEGAATATPAAGNRETGQVKWFNVTKGFGFIVRDNGEEIFVHFRSIRGHGRRGLKDGQRVSFVVTDSDKGPQAEDVEADERDD